MDLRTIENNRKALANKLSKKLGGQIKQFFWGPKKLQQMINDADKARIQKHIQTLTGDWA